MAYEKHDWKTGEDITEPLLDAMEDGVANAYITTVDVNVDNNTGTPEATGSVNGNTLTLEFKNLKGEKGDTGAAGAGLTGSAASITALSTETATDMKNKINEIITQLKARGVTK